MRFKTIRRMFERGNVCVFGLRGTGKDLLTANVCVRRKKPYISNVAYDDNALPFDYSMLDVGGNYYPNFISGRLKRYVFPYADGTDVYMSDAGIYFPSQYCSELDRKYPQMAVFQGLSRHLGKCNFHVNTQSLDRIWKKIREQSDQYILCRRCFYLFGFVIQFVRIYDRYESANNKHPPFDLRPPLFTNKEMRLHLDMARKQYEAQYGSIKSGVLFYRNRSKYDTRRFKAILEEGSV